jgi:hypothetical protein
LSWLLLLLLLLFTLHPQLLAGRLVEACWSVTV